MTFSVATTLTDNNILILKAGAIFIALLNGKHISVLTTCIAETIALTYMYFTGYQAV